MLLIIMLCIPLFKRSHFIGIIRSKTDIVYIHGPVGWWRTSIEDLDYHIDQRSLTTGVEVGQERELYKDAPYVAGVLLVVSIGYHIFGI